MATSYRIRCVTRTCRRDPHERILSVGGRFFDYSSWSVTQQEAIVGIESGGWTFFVEPPDGAKLRVVVATNSTGDRYLKTEADGEQPDILLTLPECLAAAPS